MTNFTFADIYRSAQFSLEPSNMALREKSANRFLSQVTFDDCLGLVRLHLGLGASVFRDRLVQVFRDDDPTFSIVGTERELVILSTGLLASVIENGDTNAALALVTGTFASTRVAEICPQLAEWAKEQLYDRAVNERVRDSSTSARLQEPVKNKSSTQLEAWALAPDLAKLAPVLKATIQENEAAASAIVDQANSALGALATEARNLRQELDMLWWHVGGFSRQLKKPFSDLPKALVPGLTGLELADLTRNTLAPAAIGALIQLRIRTCEVASSIKVSDVIDAIVAASVSTPTVSESDLLTDLTPMLIGVHLSRTTGDGSAWQAAFKNRTGFAPSSKLPSLDLGMQVFREVLLVNLRAKQ